MRRLALVSLMLAAGPAAGQISSPPPAALRAGSGTPLSETFTPDTLFPKSPAAPPPPPAPAEPAPVDTPDGGLLPPPPPKVKVWAGSADLGLNGAAGNSELVNVRGGWNVRRKTDRNALTSDLQYVYAQQDHATKTHQALFNARDEVLFPGSPWSAFGATQLEYDQLRAYRFRAGEYAGAGFAVADGPDLVVKTRAGVGATREFGVGGTRDRWVAELLFGYDFRYRVNDRGTVVSILDYYPRASDPREWRLRARVAYEYVLDPARGAFLRVGVQERYDSDPGNAKRNDVSYFATLGVKF